ncbi:MAG: aldehyde ferredoxin oxidoreductase [Deltaproteobacteria bacterium]|jgi:glyceraldehyde-3-phosphate dehydrogenase (ferredoxin)|nr:aldehyde ferredoxin oxidoreductase [Deltaproteobacteria bacterium]
MAAYQKVLFIDCGTAFYKIQRFKIGDFFGPVDLGLYIAGRYNSLNIGTGLLAGSVFPGSNRLIFNGFSPCWGGFYISSMGGAALVFDNLGINMLSLLGKASAPSIMYLNRTHGEEIQIEIFPVDIHKVWKEGRGGIYSLMGYALNHFGEHYETDPRILVVGPAAGVTDFGAIASVPVKKGKLSSVDTWAGRGGFGSKMFKEHGIAAIIYGGTHIDEDFRDRKVADQWFENKYHKKMSAVDLEATTKYRFEPNFDTGGTFGVNYATIGGRLICFNYKSIYMEEDERLAIHSKFILNHYLKQFNEETIKTKQYRNCGEPCAAVCKKMHGEYKKDYEPYQTMGPLTGIFDQRAAEQLNQHANLYGFDAISVGGVLSWLMECLSERLLAPEDLGINGYPVFSPNDFDIVSDSMHNAQIGIGLLDTIIEKRGIINIEEGARKFARRLSRERGKGILNPFLYTAFARKGWMVPNQYWTPGALSPMPIMGKYYMHYGNEFFPPRELGHRNAKRMLNELTLDNFGMCRFHRLWAEEMIPEIMESLYGIKEHLLENISMTASRINSRNSSIFWESERNIDFVHTFLKRQHTVEESNDTELMKWLDYFKRDKHEAALSFWYEVHKGILESLREF